MDQPCLNRGTAVICIDDNWQSARNPNAVYPRYMEKFIIKSIHYKWSDSDGMEYYYTFFDIPDLTAYNAKNFKKLDLDFAGEILRNITLNRNYLK